MTHAQRVEILEQKLRHLRNWMTQLHKMMEGSNQMAAQNSKRLFVGGLPNDITQVCASQPAAAAHQLSALASYTRCAFAAGSYL